MWLGKKVSVIFPTYNEKDSIRAAIEDFFASGVVDEIVVVNNNAAQGTSEEVAKTRAREVIERRQGYGAAIRRGLEEAAGDLLIVAEPDGTFAGRDVHKLLAYAEDFDIVYGSRTVNDFIWEGANMGLFLRWGNWAVAKMMEVLFNSTSLTDVGCTVRLLKREAYERLAPHFTVDGNFFGPEMMLLSIHGRMDVVQIPVNYLPRVGQSSVTGSFWKAFALGMRMIALILEHRAKRFVGWKPSDRPADMGAVSAGLAAFGQGLLLLIFVGLCATHLFEPFVIDEMDFPALGRAIAHTGLPFYYRGETLPHYPGIYHVPFYGYALGAWLKVFGDSIAAVRSFGLLCLIVAWALGFRILRQICRALDLRFQAPALFYSLLLLTSPFYIQSAVLPDIDETTLIVAYLATSTLLLNWMRKPSWRRAFWCGVALGTCLLSKMTTTWGLFALVPMAAWFAAQKAGARTWIQAAFIPATGVALFLASWGALAYSLSLDFWYPFKFTFQSASKGTASGGRLAGALLNLSYNVRELKWLGFGMSALLVVGLAGGAMLALRRPAARGPLLLVVAGAAFVFGAYGLIIGPVFGFCKYYVVAMPLAAAVVALVIGSSGALRLSRGEVLWLGGLSLAALAWMVAFERDHALIPDAPTILGLSRRASVGVAGLVLLLGAAVLWRARRQGRVGSAIPFLLPLLILTVAQGTGVAWAQARAPYSTRYYYGERGFSRVVETLKAQLAPGEPVLAAKDIGMALDHPFFEDALFFPDKALLDELLANRRPRFAVTRHKFDYSFQVYPHARRSLEESGYRPWREIEDFTLWQHSDQTSQ